MSRIRGHDTKPEVSLRKALWRLGLRYTLKSKLPGKPDLVFPKYRTALFVDGCFWHGCRRHMNWPKNRAEFWQEKISANTRRDHKVNRLLRAEGWTVVRVWTHEINKATLPALAQRLQKMIRG